MTIRRAVRVERHAYPPSQCGPSIRGRVRPVRASHTFAVPSSLPVTIRVPSGLNDTLFTAPCGLSDRAGRSRPPVPHLRRPVRTTRDDSRPSGLNDALVYELCGRSGREARPGPRVPYLCLALSSPPPVTIRVPSGLNDCTLASPVALRVRAEASPVRASQTFAVLLTAGDDPHAVRAERDAPTHAV